MKPAWRATRVCGPAVLRIDGGAPIAVAAITARGGVTGWRLAPVTVMAEPFEFEIPREALGTAGLVLPCASGSSVGHVELRPLESADAAWLPSIAEVGQTPEMLGELVEAVDRIERSDDEGPYDVAEWGPVDVLEFHVSPYSGEVFGLSWRADEQRGDRWWRADRGWVSGAPVTGQRWLRALGPVPWTASTEATTVRIHPGSALAALAAFDSGPREPVDPIPAAAAGLFALDGEDGHVMRGDLPAGEGEAVARWWLDRGGDPGDVIVAFGDGAAELPAELVRDALLDRARDRRGLSWWESDPAAVDRVGAAMAGTPWGQLAVLAREAGGLHVAHSPCDDASCRRFHAALEALSSGSRRGTLAEARDELEGGRSRRRALDDIRVMLTSVLRSRPAGSPFDGFLEAPETVIALASRWMGPIREATELANARTIAFAAYLLAIEYPDAQGVDIEAAADAAARPWSPDDDF